MNISKVIIILLCLIEIPFQLVILIVMEARLLDLLAVLLDFLFLGALVGFVWQRQILSKRFWQFSFVVIVVWQAFFAEISFSFNAINIGILNISSMHKGLLVLSISLLLIIQIAKFIALYGYAFRSPEIWGGARKSS